MINRTLMLYCLLAGGGYLLVFTILYEMLGAGLKITRGIPKEMLEPAGLSVLIVNFVMESLFFVVIPTIAYSFFSVVLPLSGVRPAIAVALAAFTLGSVPALMGLSMRMRLWMPYLLYFLLGLLLKLAGSIAIIGYIYNL